VSVGGFPEQDHFQALSRNMRLILGDRLVAEIYRHTSQGMRITELAPQVLALGPGPGRSWSGHG
jgi:hypothetical protein